MWVNEFEIKLYDFMGIYRFFFGVKITIRLSKHYCDLIITVYRLEIILNC